MEMADLTTWQKNTSRCDEKSLISLKWNWNLHSLEAGFEAHNTALAESLSTLNLAWKEFENYWRASKISDTTASLSSLTNKTYLLPIKKKKTATITWGSKGWMAGSASNWLLSLFQLTLCHCIYISIVPDCCPRSLTFLYGWICHITFYDHRKSYRIILSKFLRIGSEIGNCLGTHSSNSCQIG